MKYIRTKDGVYFKIRDTEYNNEHIVVGKTPIDFGTYILKKDIVGQADTIEELCDEFVGIDMTCENGHQLLRTIPYKCANFWNGGIYGAVWCEFGLKYVAKLNSKGELELI